MVLKPLDIHIYFLSLCVCKNQTTDRSRDLNGGAIPVDAMALRLAQDGEQGRTTLADKHESPVI